MGQHFKAHVWTTVGVLSCFSSSAKFWFCSCGLFDGSRKNQVTLVFQMSGISCANRSLINQTNKGLMWSELVCIKIYMLSRRSASATDLLSGDRDASTFFLASWQVTGKKNALSATFVLGPLWARWQDSAVCLASIRTAAHDLDLSLPNFASGQGLTSRSHA